MHFVFLLFVAIPLTSSAGSYKEVTIGTKLGRLKGIERSVLGKTLHEFRRIPFAKAPVGNLRFEKPKLFGSWNDTLDGTSFGPSCYQEMGLLATLLLQNKNISEDCLFLNIQVPTPLSSGKPVMIWIHGGGYHEGQASLYDGGHLAVIGDVIVVTVNYRLNVFGFLSTGVLKGNYGLWDQIMAMQWIKENIIAFGGDNQSITVFGESAGAFSVGLLALMPPNQGLFQRVILQSGVAITPYAMNTLAKQLSISIAEHSNCTASNNHILVKCLKDKAAEELFQVYKTLRYKHPNLLKIPLTPVMDDELLLGDPLNILHDIHSSSYKFFRSLDVMIGTVTGEASLMIQRMIEQQELFRFNIKQGIPKRVLTTFIAPLISAQLFNNVSQVTSAIIEKYGQWTDETNQTRIKCVF